MPEISEQINEVLEKAEENKSALNTIVAIAVALSATIMALGNVKGGNVDQAMNKVQVEIVDTWSYFQAKSTKQSLAEAALDQLTIESPQLPPEQAAARAKQIEAYRAKAARYEREKDELKTKVEELQKEYERLNVRDDQFDISEALLSVGIALFGITALTQKRWMVFVAAGFAAFGTLVNLAGFFGWNLRPEWLARILGA